MLKNMFLVLVICFCFMPCRGDTPNKIFTIDFNSANGKSEIKVGDFVLNVGTLGGLNTFARGLNNNTTNKVTVGPSLQNSAVLFDQNSTSLYFSNAPITLSKKFSYSVMLKVESDTYQLNLLSSDSGARASIVLSETAIDIYYAENSSLQKHLANANLQLTKNVWVELLISVDLNLPLNQQIALSKRLVESNGQFQSVTTQNSDIPSFALPIENSPLNTVNFLKLDSGSVTVQNFKLFNDADVGNVETYLLNSYFVPGSQGDIGVSIGGDFYNRIQSKMVDVANLTQAQIIAKLASQEIAFDNANDMLNKYHGVVMFKISVDKNRFSSGDKAVKVYVKVKDNPYKFVVSKKVDFSTLTENVSPVYLFWDTRSVANEWTSEDAKATRLNPGEIKFKFTIK